MKYCWVSFKIQSMYTLKLKQNIMTPKQGLQIGQISEKLLDGIILDSSCYLDNYNCKANHR